MALTEMAVRNAKARENGGNYSLSDGNGLMLLVKKSGAKSWVLRYWLDGKEKKAGLGPYPLIGLADARKLKNAFKHELVMGVNPQEKKRAEREEAAHVEAIKAMTFARVAEEWYQQQAGAWSASHCTDVRHKLRAYILPRLGECPVREISTQAVIVVPLSRTKKGLRRV